MSDDRVRVCAVCGRVLDIITRGDHTYWTHTLADLPADHPAVPATVTEVAARYRCDFCSADQPRWVLPARPFQLDGIPQAAVVEAWAACDTCAGLIRANRWTALRDHVVATARGSVGFGLTRRETQAMGAALDRLYRQLRANITGTLHQIDT
jgi:hypothetical protein